MSTVSPEEDKLIDDFLVSVVNDPLAYVMGAFPWDSDPSIQIIPLQGKYKERFPDFEYGPDIWQCEYLDDWGKRLRESGFNGRDPVDPLRFTTVSGHGIGKSALVAMCIKFILDTRPESVGTVTANTSSQLRTKTWAEVGKWHMRSITAHRFRYFNASNNMTLKHVDETLGQTWKCSAQTCDVTNSEAFAGQHSSTCSFYIFDEASNIHEKLFEVREGGMIAGQPISMDFGNGTRNTGRFFENTSENGRFRKQYIARSIDSREAYRTNKKKIADDIELHGEESDYVKTRWRGLFPDQSQMQFFSTTDVQEAMYRDLPPPNRKAELVFGVDVAKSSSGDETVIKPRFGNDLRSYKARKFRGLGPHEIAYRVADYVREFTNLGINPTRIFVDGGGGYGGGVVAKLRELGLPVTEVMPGRKATNDKTYALKVDECWGTLRERLPDLILPDMHSEEGKELYDQLTQREYSHTLKEQVRLEPKQEFADRIGQSPDLADAYALTFAEPVFNQGAFDGGPAAEIIYVKGL